MKNLLDLLRQDKKSAATFIGFMVIVALVFSVIFFAIGNYSLTNVVVTEEAIAQKLQHDEEYKKEKTAMEEEKNKLSREIASLETDFETAKSFIDDYKTNKDKYEGEISEKKADVYSLDQKIKAKTEELAALTANVEQKKGEPIYLTAGYYTSGTDFPAGKYNIEWVSGSGNVFGHGTPSINEIFGEDRTYHIKEYKNAKFSGGSTLEIRGNLQIRLVPIL